MVCFSVRNLIILTIINIARATENITDTEIENFHKNRHKRQDNAGWQFVDCILPPHPENGQWQVISGIGTPGSSIFPNTLIQFSCNEGFELFPKTPYFICDIDWDPSKMPRCKEKLCPPIKSSSVKNVKCFNGKGRPIECNKVTNGGTAATKCPPYYELSSEQASTIQCLNEKWSETPPECIISCGQAVKEQELAMTYKNKTIPKYPWIASLYNKHESGIMFICSGNLISPSHVLTAAHCVSNYMGDANQPSEYQVSAGKTYQSYGDPRDLMAQYVDIMKIKIHEHFEGAKSNYKGDIAILKTKRPFRLSPLVQPICIKGLPDISLTENNRGVVPMWGVQQDGKLTEEVQYFESNINQEDCIKKLDKNFVGNFLLSDKFCVHFEERRDSICKGYSGAGFAVSYKNRFFLEGIVSVGPYNLTRMCSDPTNLCTKLMVYYNFTIDAMENL